MSSGSRWLVALLLAGALSGCKDPNAPVQVEGKVLLNEQPLEGAQVTFVPTDNTGRIATAVSRADGTFHLRMSEEAEGVLRGPYKILVKKEQGGPPSSDPGTPSDPATEEKRARSLLPVRYGDLARTPFSCTVPPNEPIVLKLKNRDE